MKQRRLRRWECAVQKKMTCQEFELSSLPPPPSLFILNLLLFLSSSLSLFLLLSVYSSSSSTVSLFCFILVGWSAVSQSVNPSVCMSTSRWCNRPTITLHYNRNTVIGCCYCMDGRVSQYTQKSAMRTMEKEHRQAIQQQQQQQKKTENKILYSTSSWSEYTRTHVANVQVSLPTPPPPLPICASVCDLPE